MFFAQDRLIEEVNQKQQAIYDARLAAEDAARKALMREVVDTRAQQIQWKYEERLRDIEEVEHERRRLEEENRVLSEMEDAVRAERHETRLRAQQALLDQVAAKNARVGAERAAETAANRKVMEQMLGQDPQSQKYIQGMKAEEPPAYYGRKKVEWFY